jgi:hypothetical protein
MDNEQGPAASVSNANALTHASISVGSTPQGLQWRTFSPKGIPKSAIDHIFTSRGGTVTSAIVHNKIWSSVKVGSPDHHAFDVEVIPPDEGWVVLPHTLRKQNECWKNKPRKVDITPDSSDKVKSEFSNTLQELYDKWTTRLNQQSVEEQLTCISQLIVQAATKATAPPTCRRLHQWSPQAITIQSFKHLHNTIAHGIGWTAQVTPETSRWNSSTSL